MKSKKVDFYPKSFIVPAIAIYGVFFILPTLVGFGFSFTNWNSDNLTNWFAIKYNGIDNFKYLFENENFNLALYNTVFFALVTTFLKTVIGLLLALGLNQPLATKSLLRGVFYVPNIISIIVIGLLFSSIFSMTGMFNQALGSIGLSHLAETNWLGDPDTAFGTVIAMEVWKASGFSMIIFLAGLQGIPRELYEAATIDGADGLKKFRNITLPMLAPAFTIAITISLISGFKVFDQVYVLTNGHSDTEVINTFIFRAFSAEQYGRASAMNMILFLCIAIVNLLVITFLRKKEVEL